MYIFAEILYDIHISILLHYKITIVQMLSTRIQKIYFNYLLKQH